MVCRPQMFSQSSPLYRLSKLPPCRLRKFLQVKVHGTFSQYLFPSSPTGTAGHQLERVDRNPWREKKITYLLIDSNECMMIFTGRKSPFYIWYCRGDCSYMSRSVSCEYISTAKTSSFAYHNCIFYPKFDWWRVVDYLYLPSCDDDPWPYANMECTEAKTSASFFILVLGLCVCPDSPSMFPSVPPISDNQMEPMSEGQHFFWYETWSM